MSAAARVIIFPSTGGSEASFTQASFRLSSARLSAPITVRHLSWYGCYSYPDWMMAGVKATYWAVIGADNRAVNSPNEALVRWLLQIDGSGGYFKFL